MGSVELRDPMKSRTWDQPPEGVGGRRFVGFCWAFGVCHLSKQTLFIVKAGLGCSGL